MTRFGYYRIATAVPRLRVADVSYNLKAMLECMDELVEDEQADVVLFPELCITSYSCGDLFYQPLLIAEAKQALLCWADITSEWQTISVIGLPILIDDGLYNVAAVIQSGEIKGLVPKSIVPNYAEFYEKRHFRPAKDLSVDHIELGGNSVPIGTDLLFSDGGDLRLGIELCEDLWSLIPPSSYLARQGARLLLNPSASNDYVGKAQYRRSLVQQQSARCLAVYAYASAGVHESTQDLVYGGHTLIADNGRLVAEGDRFQRDSATLCADVDLERLSILRQRESSYHDTPLPASLPVARVIELITPQQGCDRRYAQISAYPFLPTRQQQAERCEEILDIQSHALAKRVECTGAESLVIGISGGLDSTLALLVCLRTCQLLGKNPEVITAVTMPGFGTTDRTYQNAVELINQVGASFAEISIKESCLLHFKDLCFDPKLRTNTYENVQARERTKILMNLANKLNGIVVGTGDLSEIALGWSTYNADHMSMYSVNCSIPKTLIRCLIEHAARHTQPAISELLYDINATPVSPELLPPAEDGSIEQKTEDIIGPYDLHDFYLYHFIKHAAEPAKLAALAEQAFEGQFSRDLQQKTLATFLRRFFSQQFKRSCIPDGPKVGSISLSPRGDWRMPSDASASSWL